MLSGTSSKLPLGHGRRTPEDATGRQKVRYLGMRLSWKELTVI